MTQTLNHRPWLNPSAALNRLNVQQETLAAAPAAIARLRYGFRVGAIGLLIEPDTLSEVVEKPLIYPLPNTPAWLTGLINLRGNLVPLFDLRPLLEADDGPATKQSVLILDDADAAVGILIDGLPHNPDLSRRLQRLPPLPPLLRDHAAAAYVKDGTVWLEFNHRGFFQTLAARIA